MLYATIPSSATLKPEPYKVEFPQQQVDKFYQLLSLSELSPKTYENNQSDVNRFGVTYQWMSHTKQYWEKNYDWRKREDKINSFPNFKVDIKDDDGYVFNIHFRALFSKKPNAIPIVFLHGWPGSFLEFTGIFTKITSKYTPETLPYHIISPSLPGYTLSSGPPTDKDFTTPDIARIIDKLMTGLGFESGYIGQGGDIGAYTCRALAQYPSCKAIHLNFSMMEGPPASVKDNQLKPHEQKGLKNAQAFKETNSAYALEHGTRPSTIGFVLSSSPLAVLAWIGEKFLTWTDQPLPPLDDILDSITLYWFTQSFARCIYPYREYHGNSEKPYFIHSDPKYYINKPLGYSYFPEEIAPMPVSWVAETGKLVSFREHESGGHFAAMERPDELWGDVEEFVKVAWKQ